ncbi:NfeD family protein [Aliidiomarina sanyensis]|uniref:Peptidase n=1 Tax=Aliidiomarina sanyensis TaxID=1249555 RepID=A0A432WRV5_9GAMM|nr:NfeD family protein [Aliidiomarina sanyensis]RUO36498.1 peptidase [Aliidiomarina sanyensis]
MTTAMWWIIIGIVLIISELLATSIIAVFLGIAAILTGLALHFGLIEGVAAQYTVFGVLSVLLLVTARGKFKRWFSGFTADNDGEHGTVFKKDIGERVTVHTDFEHGAGRVILNGVQWDAASDEPLKKGDVAWVISHQGIRLTVSSKRPELP